MLSVRRRQEDAQLGGVVGLRGMGEEDDAELEEGEACGDDTAFVDPDVALSYIDEKLEYVLGHFQKEFEGGVSAENLGSKFGGYGSFLPTYQRSPLQTRSPPKAPNISSRSPYHQSTEGTPQNHLAVGAPSVSKNNGSMVPFSDDSSKKEIRQSTKGERGSSTHDSSYVPTKCGDNNRLKVRIKIGSDNVLARNNAAIYSGLGLDISSPSSIEDSPDHRGSLSPEFNNVPLESPQTILQIMTCFAVPGGFLLSPLQGNVLQLTKKVMPSSKKWETGVYIDNAQGKYEGHTAKRMKPDGKKKKSVDTKRSKSRNDISAVLKKDIDIETPAGQKIVSEALNIPLLSNYRTMEAKGESHFKEETTGNTLESYNDALFEERTKTEVLENGGFGISEMDVSAGKGGTKLTAEKTETALEERDTTNERDFQLHRKHDKKIRNESKCHAAGVNKVINEITPTVCRSMEKVPSKEALLNDINEETVCRSMGKVPSKEASLSNVNGETNSKSDVKILQREQNMNVSASSDFLEEAKDVRSSAAVKDRKPDSQHKSSHSGKKHKVKPHRDVRGNLPEGSYGSKEHGTLENGSHFGELRPKERYSKNDSERDSDMPGTSKREMPSSLNHDRHTLPEEQKMHIPPSASVSTAHAAPTLPVPVVIEEHWVCCDICQRWRLLPYEMDPSTLPKKWKCSMQQWLPGMNRCDFSEDETTNALNALYAIPAANGIPSAGHSHVASAALTTSSTSAINGHVEQSRKRKNANGLVDNSHPTQASDYPKSNQNPPARSKNTADGSQIPIDRDSSIKSVDLLSEKKRSRSKSHGGHSYEGHHEERSKKHSKVKSKREMDHDEYRTSKKIKKQERRHSSIDCNPRCDVASGDIPDEANVLPAKAIMAFKSSDEKSDVPSSKQKNVSRHNSSLEKSKRSKDDDTVLPEDKNKEHFHLSDVQRSELSSKKRIVKEWEENQHNSTAQASKGSTLNHSSAAKETYKDQNMETKPKLTRSEEQFSITNSKSVKVPHRNQVLSYNGDHLNNELVEDSTVFADKRGPSELLESRPSKQSLDVAEPTYVQTAAVTSTSSQVSGSQKKKQNSEMPKTSPIECVSSSPPRNSKTEKVSHNIILAKNGSLSANTNATLSLVKFSNTEDTIVDNVRQTRKSHENTVAMEPVLHGFQRNSDKVNEMVRLSRGHASDGLALGTCLDDDLQHASGRKDSSLKVSSLSRGHNHLHSGDKNSLLTDGSPMHPRTSDLDNKGDSIARDNKRSATSLQDRNGSTHYPPDGNSRSNKQDMQSSKAQMVPSPLKETKLESQSTQVISNASKLTPQLRRCNENGGQRTVVKQAICNPTDTSSPIRKDGNSTAYALKEARDLKHKANHLKNEGKELESTRLYFEAALKFLHVASILEISSTDGFKQGDVTAHSLYSDTAKFCNFVGHAYEKSKKMPAAALAFKCVEVAYLKAAYCKYPTANKDRQVLQALVQTPPGESPSSSASDIDNLNNNGLSKATSSKDANSPQVTGNHLLQTVRSQQAHLMRLLAYTNDVNCAFDATRKAQMAIASAAGNPENGTDSLSSVRTVLDFNFQNVTDLLRLVRLSMESISC